jgi:ABC-type uncharacterized transport system substrate-binding protein
MKRREFITMLGGAAAGWPLAARAQQPAMPVVGFLGAGSGSAAVYAPITAAFRQGLGETGLVEGRNVAIEFRWADGRYERLPAMAAELVGRQVAVIVASGGTVTARAAMAATKTTPIVFNSGSDPVADGLVASLNRPDGNVTGVFWFAAVLGAKRLEALRELVPKAGVIALLLNPDGTSSEPQLRDAQAAAGTLGLPPLQVVYAGSERDLDSAFATLTERRIEALLVGGDPTLFSRRERIVSLTARYRIPAIYVRSEFVAAGGLMSYGTSLRDSYRRAGVYAGRILQGVKPAELPVEQSVKIELVINLKTAKALGLEVPPTVLARADEVIE